MPHRPYCRKVRHIIDNIRDFCRRFTPIPYRSKRDLFLDSEVEYQIQLFDFAKPGSKEAETIMQELVRIEEIKSSLSPQELQRRNRRNEYLWRQYNRDRSARG